MIIINHISLLTEKPLLPMAINELTFNGYNLGIFLTLMLLIRHWAIIPFSLNHNVTKYSTLAKVGFYVTSLLVGSFTFVCDIMMFIYPDMTDLLINIQHHMWGFACIINGLLFALFGYLLLRSLTSVKEESGRGTLTRVDSSRTIEHQKNLFFLFKFIYYLYVGISGPYAALYFIVIYVKTNPFVVWFFVYGILNLAGPLTAIILAPIVK